MPSRSDNTRSYAYGLRGRNLARLRDRENVGQRHLANVLGLSQPELSFMEREKFGGIPRGFSTRYRNAVADIVKAGRSECFKGCGCVLCPGEGCRFRAAPGSKFCGGGGCAVERVRRGKASR